MRFVRTMPGLQKLARDLEKDPGLDERIRAFKVVRKDYGPPLRCSTPNGNPMMVGSYRPGNVRSVPYLNTDRADDCGSGLHLATPYWIKDWWDVGTFKWSGHRIMVVEFNPKDGICIPHDTDGKWRVKKLKVIKEVKSFKEAVK